MGIKGLHKYLSSITKKANLKQFSGLRVAVDANCWLHRGTFCCISDLFHERPTTMYLKFCSKMIKLLTDNKIIPILVFDGLSYPLKSETNEKRSNDRKTNREMAFKLLSKGKKGEAYEFMRRSVGINFSMVQEFIKLCVELGIDYIVAPYEADSQIAYLCKTGTVDFAISEDSDLLAFGCSKVLYKLDDSGSGEYVDMSKAEKIFKSAFEHTTFLKMCILAGCDYLPSLPGIGIVRSSTIMFRNGLSVGGDVKKEIIAKVRATFPNSFSESQLTDYSSQFSVVYHAFFYQPVFDIITGSMTYLNPLSETADCNMSNECILSDDYALNVALGNVNTKTGDVSGRVFSIPTRGDSIWSSLKSMTRDPLKSVNKEMVKSPIVKRKVRSKYFANNGDTTDSPNLRSKKRKLDL